MAQVTLTPPAADSYVQGTGASANTDAIWTGRNTTDSVSTRGLVRFDLSSVPAGATIVSAVLRLDVISRFGVLANPQLFRATTLVVDGHNQWSDHDDAGLGVATTVQITANGLVDFPATAHVQAWIDGETNNGFLIIGGRDGSNNEDPAVLFGSKEGAGGADPALIVTYNRTPGVPGAFTSPSAGAEVDTTASVVWGAAVDADGDSLTYDAQLSTDGGATWAAKRTKAAGLSFTYDYSSEPATTTARWRTRAWDGLAYGDWRESANFTILHNVAPTGPSLVSPTNGGTADLAAGYTFRLTPQDADTGDSTIAYAFRRKVSGAASYEYWNAALAAWQITEVWNTVTAVPKGSELPVTFGSGKWANATTYNWSARTRDALGVDGPYATDSTVTANIPPTVDVLQPSGTVTTTSRPVVTWSYTDPENNPQDAYRVRVFTAAQYGAGGFDPATSTSVWDSGVVLSATARDTQVGVDLEEGVQYRAYVQSRQQLGSAWSAWAWELFTLQLERPVAPVVVVTPEPDTGLVRLDIAGADDGAPYSAANTTVQVQWTDDGDTWTELRDSPTTYTGAFTATLYDREAPPGAQRLYRVRTVGDV